MNNLNKVKLVKLENSERYQRLLNKDLGTSGVKAGHVLLKPSENIGEHSTNDREEVIIFLKGNGEVVIENDILKIESNSVLYIPPQTKHDIKNIGRDDLDYIYVTSLVK